MLLRPILLFIAFVTVLLAATVTFGRVFVMLLPSFEDELNDLLRARQIDVQGLSGRWRYLNPVFEAESIRFIGGRARGVGVEVDLLESAWRGTIVARAARVTSLELGVVRTSDGQWTLGGVAGGRAEIRLSEWLREGDAFWLPDVRIAVLEQRGGSAETLGEYVATVNVQNVGSRHRGEVVLAERERPCADCDLVARWDLRRSLFGATERGDVSIDGRNFRIPEALGLALGSGGFRLASLRGRWHVEAASGSGGVTLVADRFGLPTGHLDEVRLDASGASRDGDVAWARISTLDVASSAGTFGLTGTTAVTDLDTFSTDIRLPIIDVAELAAQVRAIGAEVEPLTRWVDTLDARGRIESLAARFDVPAGAFYFEGNVEGGAIEHYKGVPMVRNGRARLLGFERGIAMNLVEGPMTVGLLDLFARTSEMDRMSGQVFLWFSPDYLGVRGTDLEGAFGESTIAGSFAVTRPDDPLEQRVIVNVGLHQMDAAQAKTWVPNKLPEPLIRWIDQAVLAGTVNDVSLAYHGHTRTVDPLPMRHLEIEVSVTGGAIAYHPDWPSIDEIEGKLFVSFEEVRGSLESATTAGMTIDDGSLVVPRGASLVRVEGVGRGDGGAALGFVHASPLGTWLPQIDESWEASGPLKFAADLTVPLKKATRDDSLLAVDLAVELGGVTLDATNIGLVAGDLKGEARYRHPFNATAEGITGELFARPATFGATSEDGSVKLTVSGEAGAHDVATWLGIEPVVFSGEATFDGALSFWPERGRPAELEATSDLLGVAVALPAELGKPAAEARRTRVTVRFEDDLTALNLASVGLDGWVHVVEGRVVRGAFGVGVAPAPESLDAPGISVIGHLGTVQLDQWVAEAWSGSTKERLAKLPELRVERFGIAHARVKDIELSDLLIDAHSDADGYEASVTAPEVVGGLSARTGEVPKLVIEKLALPARDGDEDPLAGFDLRSVPNLDAEVAGITTGGSDRGTWRFSLRQEPEGVAFTNLVGDVNGLHVESEPGGLWSLDSRTRLTGHITTHDVAQVLVAYGYAPSVETDSVKVDAALSWPGSPLAFGLPHLSGHIAFEASDGRFLDVEGGGMRIFSLLNFTAIAKRMALDFSDVFGKGVSFDEISAETEIEDGLLRFVEPLDVAGTGSNFRVSGTVDLDGGVLDNEMIVTLPVSASLPWYAAYLGIVANPLVAGAVIVGERLFRNQIEQFSSAKYKIEGTLDEPKVSFVRVFTTAMDDSETEAAAPPQTPESETGSAVRKGA